MKVKRLAEDFVVEELTAVTPAAAGEFALYRLSKRGVGTLEAIEAIQRRWQMPRPKLSWGGLKDRHAVTTQYVTIRRGPARSLQQTNLSLEYLGRAQRAFTAADISGNRFAITLRGLRPEELQRAEQGLQEIKVDGLPNYFDDQRFGSLTSGGEFIAEPWIRGNYERALWLTFAEPNPHDRPADRTEKQILRDCWGNWKECKRLLSRSHRRSIVTFLDDRPGDFRGAWARVDQDLRSLYLAAFQSQLWNELLAAQLRNACPAESLVNVKLKTGPLPFFTRLEESARERLRSLELPLPTARTRIDSIEDSAVRELVERTLSKRGLEMREIRVKHPRDSFFSKGWRKACISLPGVEWTSQADEMQAGRKRLTLRFDLPRGSYATILIKRLSLDSGEEPEQGPETDQSGDDSTPGM